MYKKVLLAFLILAIMAGAGYGVWRHEQTPGTTAAGFQARQEAVRRGGPEAKAVHVLLLGTDAGSVKGNTDTIIAASINPVTRTISMMSIPRDSRVDIPRHGMNKINAANPFGGPNLTKQVVENLLGTWIDYYVLVDFRGAARIIDRLGGVTMNIPKQMDYDDPVQNLHIHLKPGVQHLTGRQAVEFARFRHDAYGDIGRTQRQQQLLQEMGRQILASTTIDRLPGLLPELYRAVHTDATLADAVRMVAMIRGSKQWDIVTMTLPGNFQTLDGISYWRVDPAKSRLAWTNLLAGRIQPYLDESLADRTNRAPVTPLGGNRVADSVYGDSTYASKHDEKEEKPEEENKSTGEAVTASRGQEHQTDGKPDPGGQQPAAGGAKASGADGSGTDQANGGQDSPPSWLFEGDKSGKQDTVSGSTYGQQPGQ